MGKVLKFSLIGCGGLIVLFILIGIIGVAVGGGGSTDTAGSGSDAEQVQEEVEQGQQEVEEDLESASEDQANANQEAEEVAEQAPQAAEEESDTAEVLVRVTGDPGQQFSGSYGNLDVIESVDGTTPQEFPVEDVDTGMFSMDTVTANAQKMGAGSGEIVVEIVVDGEVVKEASTTAEYGIAQVSWSPSE